MMTRVRRVLPALIAFVLLAAGLTLTVAQPLPLGHFVHSLTLNADLDGAVTVAGYSSVILQRSISSDGSAEIAAASAAAPDRERDIAVVQLIDDASGAVVFQTTVAVSRWIRAEHAIDPANLGVVDAQGSNIQGQRIPWANRAFNVKVPVIAGANRLSVQFTGALRSNGLIDLNAVAQQFGAQPHQTRGTLIPIDVHGPAGNRVDLIVMGDGYGAGEQTKFVNDATTLLNGVFSLSPYSRYKMYFNTYALFEPSTDSGVDQPGYSGSCSPSSSHPISCCPVAAYNVEPMNGVLKDTRYDTTYCYSGIARLMVATDDTTVFSDADAALPDWDEIFLVANDVVYGGSGGEVAAVSTNSSGVDILRHEVGHSLLRLDDEYDLYTPGYPPCSDYGRAGITTPCQPNVTDQTTRALIKWNRWIAGSTPIPTTTDLGEEAGLWLGAHYSSTTYYRGCFNCLMKSLGRPFGKVAAEQLPVMLYSGGWEGQSAFWFDLDDPDGIDMVEPGTVSPDPAAGTVNIPGGQGVTFSFDVLSPTDGSYARVVWTVDGVKVQDSNYGYGDTASFTYTPIASGITTLTAEVTDTAGILHPSLAYLSKTTLTWTVDAEGYSGVGTELLVNGGFEDPDPLDANLALGWTEKKLDKSKRTCNTVETTVANSGECAYLFKGVTGLNGKLKQTVATPIGDAGDAFTLRGQFDTINLTAGFVVMAKVSFIDGSKLKMKIEALPRDQAKTAPYFTREANAILGLDSLDVAQIKVQIKLTGAGGKVYVDGLQLLHYDEFLTSPPPMGRLAPPAFRGGN